MCFILKSNEIICKLGENSLAERPEIVDFRLASDELKKIDVENISVQNFDTNNNDDDSKNKGNDKDDTDNNNEKNDNDSLKKV